MQSKKTVIQACGKDAVVFGSDTDTSLTGFTYDSRAVTPGGVFVAVGGMWVDGHDYIDKAIAAGAGLIIAQTSPDGDEPDCTWVQVPDSAVAMGLAADAFYGHPSAAMTCFAVTGTNGKTTVTSMVYQVLELLGAMPGLVGTVEHRFGDVRRQTAFTTPPSADLHALMAEMRDAGVTHVALEASSHGLAQHRLAGMDLTIGAFTNLTQDHLDYHETMDAYFEAKAVLFRDFVNAAVFNVDDPAGAQLAREFRASQHRALTFSTSGAPADLVVTELKCAIDGTLAAVDSPWGPLALVLPMVGQHNVANALTTLGVLVLAGFDPADVVAALRNAPGAAGRLEVVPGPRHVLVDYAHTPDALINVCSALRPLTQDRLIVVFGAGGDRDPSKRPKMGAAVQAWADVALVTSDNPRTEEPMAIVQAVVAGMDARANVDANVDMIVDVKVIVEVDRRTAIERAIVMADRPGDVVLIAGKGHEDYQILGTEKIHFDDRQEAARVLASLRAGK